MQCVGNTPADKGTQESPSSCPRFCSPVSAPCCLCAVCVCGVLSLLAACSVYARRLLQSWQVHRGLAYIGTALHFLLECP